MSKILHLLLISLGLLVVGCPTRPEPSGDDDDSADDDDATQPDDDDDATQPDDDDDATMADGLCNAYEPIGALGSSKTFNATTQQLGTGTETMSPTGLGTWGSGPAWGISTTITADANSASGMYWLDCDPDSGDVTLVGWDLNSPSAGVSGIANYAPARTIIVGDPQVGDTWTVNQIENVDVMGTPVALQLTMAYEILREESITVPAGTFDALVVEAEYDIVDQSGTFIQGTLHGIELTWFVEDLGVVKIDHQREESEGGAMVEFQSKELQTFSGLSP